MRRRRSQEVIFSSTRSFTQEKLKFLGSRTSHTFQIIFSFLHRSLLFNLRYHYPFIKLSFVFVHRIRTFSNRQMMGILDLKFASQNDHDFLVIDRSRCWFTTLGFFYFCSEILLLIDHEIGDLSGDLFLNFFFLYPLVLVLLPNDLGPTTGVLRSILLPHTSFFGYI